MPTQRLRLFEGVQRATFIDRPNRFIVRCRIEGRPRAVRAYLPNPGRLRELFLPDVPLWVVKNPPSNKTRFTVVAVRKPLGGRKKGGRPVMLHTHKTNDVARHLVESGKVPGLETARVLAAEHTVGRSRFDFLLERDGEEVLLEVKSCTLFSDQVAMFPDAVTARGARHVRELAELSREGRPTVVLFVVQWPDARIFAPDYHTDLEFSRTLIECRHDVDIIPLAVGWTDRLMLQPRVRRCAIPWEAIEAEAQDCGSYLLLLRLKQAMTLETGALGPVKYRRGYYIYVGSAMANLTKRIERHRRLRKKHHWHIDTLRNSAEFVEAMAVRASTRLECDLAAAVRELSDWSVPRFGASDCKECDSHLFGSAQDPRRRQEFHDMLGRMRGAALS